MKAMFERAKGFDQDISSWNVSNVTTMECMFSEADAFDHDLRSWSTAQSSVAKVTTIGSMFSRADTFDNGGKPLVWTTLDALENASLTFSRAPQFNQDLSTWNMAKVKSFDSMFRNASAFNQDLSSWSMAGAVTLDGMFYQASSFNNGCDPGETTCPLTWDDLSAVETIASMFVGASAFNQSLATWNVATVDPSKSGMTNTFDNAAAFNQDLSGWCVAQFASKPQDFDADASSWDGDPPNTNDAGGTPPGTDWGRPRWNTTVTSCPSP